MSALIRWNRSIIILIWAGFFHSVLGYANPVVVLDNQTGRYDLGRALSFLEDESKNLSIESIDSESYKDRWELSQHDVLNFGFKKSAYWLKLIVINDSPTGKDWFLELAYPHHDRLSLYVKSSDSDGFELIEVGDQYPFHQRKIEHSNFVFPIHFEPKETKTLYLRSQTDSAMQFPLTGWSPQGFAEKKSTESFVIGIYYGTALAMIFYNLFLWLTFKQIRYLYYILYIIGYVLAQLSLSGLSYQYLWPQSPWWCNHGVLFFIAFAEFWVFIFSQSFLETKRITPNLHRLVNVAIWYAVFLMVATLFIPYEVAVKLIAVSGILASVLLFILGFSCFCRGYRPARFYILAFTFLQVGALSISLKNFGILPSNFFTEWGMQIGSAFEIVLLSLALGDRIRIEQQQAQKSINKLNEVLEFKVEEKTRDVQSILVHINQGIFTIYDAATQRISKDYSNFLEKILDNKNIRDQSLSDVFLRKIDIDSDRRSQIESVITASIGENSLSFEINKHVLPSESVFKSEAGPDKILETDWSPITNKDDVVEKVLVSIRDVTKSRALEAETKKNRFELEIIDEILGVSADYFQRFMRTSRNFTEDNRNHIKNNSELNDEVIKMMFINIHTVKGLARSYALKSLTGILHEIEQEYHLIWKSNKEWDQRKLLASLAELDSLFDEYDRISREKLGRENSFEEVKIDVSMAMKVVDFIESFGLRAENAPYYREISSTFQGLCYVDGKLIFKEIMAALPILAKDLEKEIPSVSITGDPIYLNKEGADLLRNIFVHVIRNSMDHGIEQPMEREKIGKNRSGQLSIHVEIAGNDLCIRYQDDGKGLDLQKIKTLAVERGLVSADDELSSEQTSRLILKSGFSTTSNVTHISGRGIGMDAVKNYLEQCGGSLEIELKAINPLTDQTPFVLKISIPSSYAFLGRVAA